MYCEASQLLFSVSRGFQFSSGPIYTNWYGIEFILKFGAADHLSVESSRSTVALSCTWSEKPFLKEGSEAEEATTPLRVLSSPANSKHNSSAFCSSSLSCLAFGLLYLLLVVQGGILCFSWNLPRFLIMLHGQRSKIQFKVGLLWKLIGICWQKERKWCNVVACMDFWNGDSHSFFGIYKILFLLDSFTRNTLSSPEKNKIYYFCNLTKFHSPKKEKKHIFSLQQNQSKYSSLKRQGEL